MRGGLVLGSTYNRRRRKRLIKDIIVYICVFLLFAREFDANVNLISCATCCQVLDE